MFLLFYPLGVGAELVCMWAAWRAVEAIPIESNRPMTITMPNSLNIEFHYGWLVWLIYFLYSFGFPILYIYMLN